MEILVDLLERYPALIPCRQSIEAAFTLMQESFRSGGKLLVCGNGGSAADSEHIVGELMKGFMLKRPIPVTMRQKLMAVSPENGGMLADQLQGALPAVSLVGHCALSTAFANDVEPSMVFAQQVYGLGQQGDVLLGISTSGNSANVCHAMEVALAMRMSTIGLTGPGGGKMSGLSTVLIGVPAKNTPLVQELHLPVYHALCAMLEEAFFDE